MTDGRLDSLGKTQMPDEATRIHCTKVAVTGSRMGGPLKVELGLVDALGRQSTLAFDGEEALEIATQILATVGEVIAHQQGAALTLN